MALSPMYKSRAEREAAAVWEDAGKPIPVDPSKIAKLHDIEIRKEDLEEDVSGMMVTREDSSVVIVVNSSHHKNRHRFSVAHELGHYFLHRAVSPIFVDSKQVFYRDATASEGTKRQEIEANAFAAELLMPESEVRSRFPHKLSLMEMDAEEVEKAAKFFCVSTTALSLRLIRLGLLESDSSSL